MIHRGMPSRKPPQRLLRQLPDRRLLVTRGDELQIGPRFIAPERGHGVEDLGQLTHVAEWSGTGERWHRATIADLYQGPKRKIPQVGILALELLNQLRHGGPLSAEARDTDGLGAEIEVSIRQRGPELLRIPLMKSDFGHESLEHVAQSPFEVSTAGFFHPIVRFALPIRSLSQGLG